MESSKCLVELEEVLNHLSKHDIEKIPKELREIINDQKD